MIITLVFHYVWPLPASRAMWRSLGSALRAMARLATVESPGDDQAAVARATEGLRLQVSHDLATAQQLADQAAFEPGDPSGNGIAARERLQRAAADAQSVFLTQLAIAHRPRDVVPALPSAVGDGLRRFDAAVSDSLDAIAQRVERSGGRPIPDLLVPLAAAVTARSDTAGHIDGRLALYRELVPRIERLAVDVSA